MKVLPRINRKKVSFSCQQKPAPVLTNTFSCKLKNYKLRRSTDPIGKNIFFKKGGQYITEPITSIQEFIKEEDRQGSIDSEKFLIKIYESNYSSKFEKMKNDEEVKSGLKEILKPQLPKLSKSSYFQKNKYGFNKFHKTIYSTESCMRDFFNKYSQFNTIYRKHPLNNCTPSLAFIKSSNEEKIIPNPLGLLKRSGDNEKLEMTFQKVGDNYINVLGNSLKYSDNLTSLELSGNRISATGINQLFSSINKNKELIINLHDIDLSENNIGNQEIPEIINFLQEPKNSIEHLNLYGNLLGDDNTKNILEVFSKVEAYNKTSLNLGKNNIHDTCANSICEMLKLCTSLRALILNHNWLHNKAAAQIINQLTSHYELRMLDLSWNVIGDDLISIPTYEEIVNKEIKHPEKNFDNFALNEALTHKDLVVRSNPLLPPIDPKAKNAKEKEKTPPVKTEIKKIPEKPKTASNFAIALGEYFTKTDLSLIHLDISYNNLNFVDCKLLSEKVKTNHEILGIHVEGNEMEIDALGFISPLEKNDKDDKYFCRSNIYYGINNNSSLRKTNIDVVRKIRNQNQCWICSGFREIEFEYIPEEPIVDPNNHLVKIHLDFDGYKPFDMICTGSKFHIVRMCPPGEVNYFFSVDTIPVKKEGSDGKNEFKKIEQECDYIKYTFDGEYMEELNNVREKMKYSQKDEEGNNNTENNTVNNTMNNTQNNTKNNFSLNDINITNNKVNIIVDTISKKPVKFNKSVITDDYLKLIQFSQPRPEKIIDKFVKPKSPWSFPISIWAYYGYDYNDVSEYFLDQCFKFDFDRCQFGKDFKDEESYETLKEMLRERYRDIIDCYKYYASMGGCQVWQITQNNLTEFISKCPGMCDKTYDINNIYITQKTVCGNIIDKEDRKKGNKFLSENLVRHQFMNLLVKAAKDKYVTVLKLTKDPLEAAKIAFEKHFDEAIKGFEYHSWRINRYYNEQVDNFLKSFLPIFDALYLSFAKQKGPRKKDVWMVLDEFNNLVQSFIDINEYPIRENPYIFNQALNLQVNEIYTDKHINMFLPEFLEAICRVIDKASPIPLGENKDDWPMPKRQAQPLINKLENILPVLIKLISHPDFKVLKEKFTIPPKDMNTGLYNPNYDSPFYQGYIIKPDLTKKVNMSKTKKENQGENTEGNADAENKNEENKEDENKKEGEENKEGENNKKEGEENKEGENKKEEENKNEESNKKEGEESKEESNGNNEENKNEEENVDKKNVTNSSGINETKMSENADTVNGNPSEQKIDENESNVPIQEENNEEEGKN